MFRWKTRPKKASQACDKYLHWKLGLQQSQVQSKRYSTEKRQTFQAGFQKPIDQYGCGLNNINKGPPRSSSGGRCKDDDFDPFISDDEEDEKVTEETKQRLQEYAKEKNNPGSIAEFNIILDVKPWGDEIDLAEMEKIARSIETDVLLWCAFKIVPVAYGSRSYRSVHCCVVEDDEVTDFLGDLITAFEDHVQSGRCYDVQ